jgi:hypothetical protein
MMFPISHFESPSGLISTSVLVFGIYNTLYLLMYE